MAWEPVAALPAGRDGATPILAHRVATPLETLLGRVGWLDHAPREIVVTQEHLYARRGAGASRVPLSSLADRTDYALQRRYVFGRRAELSLLHRDGCPVQAALDARLAAKP